MPDLIPLKGLQLSADEPVVPDGPQDFTCGIAGDESVFVKKSVDLHRLDASHVQLPPA